MSAHSAADQGACRPPPFSSGWPQARASAALRRRRGTRGARGTGGRQRRRASEKRSAHTRAAARLSGDGGAAAARCCRGTVRVEHGDTAACTAAVASDRASRLCGRRAAPARRAAASPAAAGPRTRPAQPRSRRVACTRPANRHAPPLPRRRRSHHSRRVAAPTHQPAPDARRPRARPQANLPPPLASRQVRRYVRRRRRRGDRADAAPGQRTVALLPAAGHARRGQPLLLVLPLLPQQGPLASPPPPARPLECYRRSAPPGPAAGSTTSYWIPFCACSRHSRSSSCTYFTTQSSSSWPGWRAAAQRTDRASPCRAQRPRSAAAGGRARGGAQWLEHVQSLQVIALLTNTGVHVVMCAPALRRNAQPLSLPAAMRAPRIGFGDEAGTPTTSCAPWA